MKKGADQMAISRSQLSTSFWTDDKVRKDFTPEDRLFYVYLLTSPKSSITGCYPVSLSRIEADTGFSRETIMKLLGRFETVHEVIRYDKDTNEVLILNWGRYNWTDSSDFRNGVRNAAAEIENEAFRAYVLDQLGAEAPAPAAPEPKAKDGAKADQASKVADEIIDFMNKLSGKRFRKIESNRKGIRARLAEGYTEMDAYTVVKRKWAEWKGTDMEQYFNPETLFRPSKFEKYVNAPDKRGPSSKYDNARRIYEEFRNEER